MDKPGVDDTRARWNEYAESIGLDPDEYSNKEGLIEAVEAELLLQDDDEPQDTEVRGQDDGDYEFSDMPEEYEGMSPEWRRCYDHARRKKNPPKTAALYANAHFQDG